jgi:regulator of protease activity HflC (stomatin/prohibitin superfamily)
MHEQIRAERYRRTQKVTAEGYAEQMLRYSRDYAALPFINE